MINQPLLAQQGPSRWGLFSRDYERYASAAEVLTTVASFGGGFTFVSLFGIGDKEEKIHRLQAGAFFLFAFALICALIVKLLCIWEKLGDRVHTPLCIASAICSLVGILSLVSIVSMTL